MQNRKPHKKVSALKLNRETLSTLTSQALTLRVRGAMARNTNFTECGINCAPSELNPICGPW